MSIQATRKLVLVGGLVALLVAVTLVPNRMFAQTDVTEKSRSRRVSGSEVPAPSPTPRVVPRDEPTLDSDEVVRVETNLTTIFFTAADSNRLFVNNLKKEDVRILEDG